MPDTTLCKDNWLAPLFHCHVFVDQRQRSFASAADHISPSNVPVTSPAPVVLTPAPELLQFLQLALSSPAGAVWGENEPFPFQMLAQPGLL